MDVDFVFFEDLEVLEGFVFVKIIFVNVVMGLMLMFWYGISKMDEIIDNNCIV